MGLFLQYKYPMVFGLRVSVLLIQQHSQVMVGTVTARPFDDIGNVITFIPQEQFSPSGLGQR